MLVIAIAWYDMWLYALKVAKHTLLELSRSTFPARRSMRNVIARGLGQFALTSPPKCTSPIWRTEWVFKPFELSFHRKKGKYRIIMHQNDGGDSISNSSVEDTSPDNSDEEEEKVVSIIECVFSYTCNSWFVDVALFQSVVCSFSFPGLLKLFISTFFVGTAERRWVCSKVHQAGDWAICKLYYKYVIKLLKKKNVTFSTTYHKKLTCMA